MSRRDRVSEAIRREVSIILHDELKDPRLGLVTITGVDLTQDFRRAMIFFSVLGKDEDYKKTKEALDSALGFIRKLVAQRINLRLAPEISFKEDRSTEYSVRIQEILEEIKGLSQPHHPAPVSKVHPALPSVINPKPFRKGGVKVKKKKEQQRGPKRSRRVHKKA